MSDRPKQLTFDFSKPLLLHSVAGSSLSHLINTLQPATKAELSAFRRPGQVSPVVFASSSFKLTKPATRDMET